MKKVLIFAAILIMINAIAFSNMPVSGAVADHSGAVASVTNMMQQVASVM